MDIAPLKQFVDILWPFRWYFLTIAVLAFFATIIRSAWFKGKIGEFFVNLSARLLLDTKRYHLINNVTLPTADGTTQIDHIIVSIFGIFVIETKNMKGWIFGSQTDKIWIQKIHKYSTHQFQNPLHQNYKHVKTLQSLLRLNGQQIHSVVAFVGNSTFKTEVPENVTHGKGYIKYIKSKTAVVLTEAETKEIVQKIEEERLEPSCKTDRQHVRHVQSKHGASMTSNKLWRRIALSFVSIVIFCGLWWLAGHGKLSIWLFWLVAGMSLITFTLYGLDKLAAKHDARRTPERKLHFCELLGGWPGALLAQQVFRHKSSKTSFQRTFWLMAVLNVALLAGITANSDVLFGNLKSASFIEIPSKVLGIDKMVSILEENVVRQMKQSGKLPHTTQTSSHLPALPSPEQKPEPKLEEKPEQTQMPPSPTNFFSYKISLKSGREIAAQKASRDGDLLKIVTNTGLYMEIPWQDVNYMLKTNRR